MRHFLPFVLTIIATFVIKTPQSAIAGDLWVQIPICENGSEPLGVDRINPIFSWQLSSEIRNQSQTAYQVMVASSPELLDQDQPDLWDSNKVDSSDERSVSYKGGKLQSATRYFWKIRTWDQSKSPTEWSLPHSFVTGLLNESEWKASWISEASDAATTQPASRPMPIFRKQFNTSKPVKQAILFICGLGHFELHLNGQKVGDDVLEPGWTDYRNTSLYVTRDLTSEIKQGGNSIGVLLGNGMYNIPKHPGRYQKLSNSFGQPKLIAQLHIQYIDGTTEIIATDPSWKSAPGPIQFSSTYGGEDFDARLLPIGWNQPGFDDTAWNESVVVKGPGGTLAGISKSAPPIKVAEVFTPKSVNQPSPGIYVYDFGQNTSLIPEITVSGTAGASVKLTPAELLNRQGIVNQNGSGKPAWFTYTLSGQGKETWSPRFTYYGSRYLQIEGAVPETDPNPSNLPVIHSVRGKFITSTTEPVGEFSCSNDLFNRTSTLIRWAMLSNMQSVLTDCPHREKLGWLEQTHLVGASLMYNFDAQTLMNKICWDMADAQTPEGLVPDIAPEYTVFGGGFRDSPEWGSACVLIPWQMYENYGNVDVLRNHYPMMQKYIAYLTTKSTNHILNHGLGDWYDLGPKAPGVAQLTPKSLTATAFYYRCIVIAENIARILDKKEDSKNYQTLASEVKAAFNTQFYKPETHSYATGSQTALAIPLVMKLVPDNDRAAVVETLVNEIRSRDNALTAGDVGYRYLLRALAEADRSDVIFDMNSRSDRPGYGYILNKGATSLTEAWDGSNSQNHFMLGHIMEWFYSELAGIQSDPQAPGYKHIIIRPTPVGDVTWVNASYRSVRGMIKSSWKIENGIFNLDVTIPPGSTATVYLPASDPKSITESNQPIECKKINEHLFSYEIGSGKYRFSAKR